MSGHPHPPAPPRDGRPYNNKWGIPRGCLEGIWDVGVTEGVGMEWGDGGGGGMDTEMGDLW